MRLFDCLRHALSPAILAIALFFSLAGFCQAAETQGEPHGSSAGSSTPTSALPALTVDEIASRLAQANARRAGDLRGFVGKREYNLDYRGFPGHREANMVVTAHYTAPSTKSFDVVSESGNKWVVNRVLKKLLEGEQEAADPANQRRTALTQDNYRFTLVGTKRGQYGGCYRLQAEPVRDNKYLFRGEICVNAQDFAVESMDGEPAKSPSIWIKRTRIEHQYVKIGEFWLPASNKSVTNVRLGGMATLTISYRDYELKTASSARR